MKNKRMVKFLALGISATLLIQPIAVFAEEGEPLADPVTVEVPAEVPEAVAEEPAPQMNDKVEEVVENAEADVKAALPPTEIAQNPTDFFLNKTEDHLENIDEAVETLDEFTDEATAEVKEYTEALGDAIEKEIAFDNAVNEVKEEVEQVVEDTADNLTAATNDADRVEEMAAIMYETQAAAEAAQKEAEAVAKDAQDEADAAAKEVADLKDKLDDAEDKMNAAKDAFDKALDEYDDALDAVVDAQLALAIAKTYTGSEAAVAVADATLALKNALIAQEKAEKIKKSKERIYDSASKEYENADKAAKEAEGKLDGATKALEAAQKAVDKAELIVALNRIEDAEIKIYNSYANGTGRTEDDVKAADIELAKGLIRYQLFDDVEDVNAIEFIESEEGTIIAKYETEGPDGEMIQVTQKFKFDPQSVENIHGKENSAHWLVISKVESETPGTTKVETGIEKYYTKNGEIKDVTHYFNNPYMYYTVEDGNQLKVYKFKGYGWDLHKTFTVNIRKTYEEVPCINYTTSNFYTEEAYYRENSSYNSLEQKKSERDQAAQAKKKLEDIIGKPATLEQGLAAKRKDAVDAKNAFDKADSKYEAVKKAYASVLDVQRAIKNLKATKMPFGSELALAALWIDYNMRVEQYNTAKEAFEEAAENARYTQEEANRALAALGDGFNYNTPTPAPVPVVPGNPTDEAAGESAAPEAPADDTPDYIPVATMAAAPEAPAPAAAVLGETRTGNGRAAATAVEAGEGEEENKVAAPAAVKKQEEKKEETKPVVAIEDEDTARAAAPIATQTPFPWWVLIILAAIAGVSVEEYVRRRNEKVKADDSKKN